MKLVSLFMALCLSSLVFGQANGVISGRVMESVSGEDLEYVMVRLLKSSDSSVVQGIYTGADGKFVLENVPKGDFLLKISLTSYTTTYINDVVMTTNAAVFNVGAVKLAKQQIKDLDEVKVEANRDALNVGIDKKVFNVSDDLNARGGTANDALNNVPSIEVDQDGNISLRGDGNVTILIDGRPSSLSGASGKSMLASIPASSIERIEVVNNPSAKYDPDGTSGIINIVLKKNKLKGFNGLVTLSPGSGNLKSGNVFDGSASISYRNAYFNAFASYSNHFMSGYRNFKSNLTNYFPADSSSLLDQYREGSDFEVGHTFRVGSDFYLKGRNTLGVVWTGNIGERNRKGDLFNKRFDGNDQLFRYWSRKSYEPTTNNNMDFNLNWKHDLKANLGDVILSLNQSIGKDKEEGFYDEYYYLDSLQGVNYAPLNQRLYNREKNNITTLQLDFTRKLPNWNARLEYGAKGILRDQSVSTYSDRKDTLTGLFTADTLSNFDYAYKEQIYSVYGIYGQVFGKFKVQGGLRFEAASQVPNLLSSDIKINNQYFNLFPSAHIKYELAKKQELSLSYSRRINRASAGNLNPFTSYADPFNLRKGNPYLQPEFIDSYELGYSLEGKQISIVSSVYYRYTTNVIQRVKEFYADGTSAVTYANIDQSHSGGVELVLIYRPNKWLKNTLSGNASYIKYQDDTPGVFRNNNGVNWGFKYVGAIEFWKKTASIQLNARYNAPFYTAQGKVFRPNAVDISGQKILKGGNWTVGFKVTDIFNFQKFHMELDQPNVYQESEFKWMTRRFYLTVSYKFGKLEISNKQKASAEGGGGEM